MKGMSLEITEELIARQPPEAQAIIRALLAKSVRPADRVVVVFPSCPGFMKLGARQAPANPGIIWL